MRIGASFNGDIRQRFAQTHMFRWLIDLLEGKHRPAAAEVHDVRGFRVVVENSRPDIATSAVLSRLDEALELIDRHQPWRLRHLRRDLRQISIIRYPCRGA